MDSLPKSRPLRFFGRAVVLASRAVSRFSTRYSRKRVTLLQHVVLLCLKVKKTTTYRDLCKAFGRLEMAVWRVLLNVSLADLPVNGGVGIDASVLNEPTPQPITRSGQISRYNS